MFDALRHLHFRLLWIGSLFTYAGHWINQVTLGWVAYELTGSGTVLGAILGVRAIPVLLLAPVSGVAADRYSRRALLIGASAVNVVGAFALGALLALGLARAWHLFAFVLLIGAAHVFDRTTRHTAIQDLVPGASVMNAVALNTVAFSLMRVLSPAIAGYLIAWFGSAGNFFVQGALYAIAIVTVASIAFPAQPAHEPSGSMWRNLTQGIAHVLRDRGMRAVFLFTAVPFLLLVPTWGTLLPVYAKDVFQAGPEGLGWLLAAVGIGGLMGGLAATAFSRVEHLGWLQIGATGAFILALAAIALSPSLEFALGCVVLAGVGEMVALSAGQTILQFTAPASMRGRILSVLQFNPALISIGSLLAGIGADLIGARAITLAAAGVALVLAAFLVAASPELRGVRASALRTKAQ